MNSDSKVRSFAERWVSANVRNVPWLEDFGPEMSRLASLLITAAAAEGIYLDDLELELDSLALFLSEAYENVHDPDAGFQAS